MSFANRHLFLGESSFSEVNKNADGVEDTSYAGVYFSGFGLGPLHLKSLRLCDDGTRSRSIWYFSYPIVTKVFGNGKSQKYLEFNGPKLFLIGEWC